MDASNAYSALTPMKGTKPGIPIARADGQRDRRRLRRMGRHRGHSGKNGIRKKTAAATMLKSAIMPTAQICSLSFGPIATRTKAKTGIAKLIPIGSPRFVMLLRPAASGDRNYAARAYIEIQNSSAISSTVHRILGCKSPSRYAPDPRHRLGTATASAESTTASTPSRRTQTTARALRRPQNAVSHLA